LAGSIDELEPSNLGNTGEEQNLLKTHLGAAGYVLKLLMEVMCIVPGGGVVQLGEFQ
jgi:hypothetical protein